jgi:hypothetical protein
VLGSARSDLILSSLLLASAIMAQQNPHSPRGVYAAVNVEDAVSQQQRANPTMVHLDGHFTVLISSS